MRSQGNSLSTFSTGSKILVLMVAAPFAFPASSGSRNAMLTWTPPTQNTDGSPIQEKLYYRIYRDGQFLLETDKAEVLLTSQPIGKRCYVITARDSDSESAKSAEACKTMELDAPTEGVIERPTDGSIEQR